MKKFIIAGLFLFPLATFGAYQAAKTYKSWEYMAQIEQTKYGNVFIYKIDDSTDPNIKCYVMLNDGSKYGEGTGISCVKVK